jgi:hypothetical protein
MLERREVADRCCRAGVDFPTIADWHETAKRTRR